MSLLIDGYNLLHASGILPRGIGPGTLERAREALLNFLVESLEPDELRGATAIFDAREAPRGLPRIVDHRGLRVHFAPNPGDADELIEQLILADHSPRKLVVVSSDHRLQRAARRRRATPIDSDIWYADVLRRRIARQKAPVVERPQPPGRLSESEVSYWLGKFGMAAENLPTPAEPDSRAAGRSAAPPSPFPPGYGEDLLDEE
jgi:predicted RNA-binding protein with PIN domain